MQKGVISIRLFTYTFIYPYLYVYLPFAYKKNIVYKHTYLYSLLLLIIGCFMSELIVKDNALIQASYTLGLVEQRLILLAIVEARETGRGITPDTYLDIHANHYAQQFSVSVKSAYQSLSEAVETLYQRQVTLHKTYKGHPERQKVRWVSGISYIDKLASVRIRFSPDVIPLITRLEENFTSYELEQVAGLQSGYAVRLYELLIQWRSSGKTPFFELTEFRRQLGVEPHEYTQMGNFKPRVLDLATNQINEHTDIFVSYEQVKAGRVISGFTFTLKPKKQPKEVTPKPKKPEQKSKTVKKEEQIDWMTSDILDRFISLSPSQQQAILDQVEPTLKGATQVRFKVARAGSIKQLVTEFSLDINDALMRSASNGR